MPGSKRFALAIPFIAVTAMLLAACSPTTVPVPPNQTMVPPVGTEPAHSAASSATTAPAGVKAGHALVVITEKGFSPTDVAVKVGSQVIWSNSGKESHSIVITGGASSGPIKPGGSATHTFKMAGHYTYTDGLHPLNKGTVTVSD